MTVKTYRGYGIDYNIYGDKEYSVQYYGDDCIFQTIEEAMSFIDEIKEYEPDDDSWVLYERS